MTEQHPNRQQIESISQNSTPSWKIIREYNNLCSPEEMVRILIRRQMEYSEKSMTDTPKIISSKGNAVTDTPKIISSKGNAVTDTSKITSPKREPGKPPSV